MQNVTAAARKLHASVFPTACNLDGATNCGEQETTSISPVAEQVNIPLAAAMTPGKFITHATASMPALELSFIGSTEVRKAHLDTGCNINLVSTKAFLRDKHLYGDKCSVNKVQPFVIKFADGRTTSASHVAVDSACVVIGDAAYEVDLIVMDNLSTDYLFGFAWMFEYDVWVRPQASTVSMGVSSEDYLGEEEKPPKYQHVPISYSTKVLTLPLAG